MTSDLASPDAASATTHDTINDLRHVDIWADGSCRPNPGDGGWAAILRDDAGRELEISGAERDTTNNRMELTAAIRALERVKAPRRVTVWMDSEYGVLGMTHYLPKWRAAGWKNGDRKPVKNADLWQRLAAAAAPLEVTWRWTRGHAGDPMNERADALANKARERLR